MATITKENIGQLHEKISVQVDTADYLSAFEKSLKEYSKKANIPGFRPGKVPAGIIKKMHGAPLFIEEVLKAVDKELIDYLDKEKLEIFGQPLALDTDLDKLDFKNPGSYNFQFEIGLKPQITLPALDTLALTGYNITVDDKMIDEEVERLQNKAGKMEDKEVIDGDENVINVTFVETDAEGNPLEEGIAKDNSLLVKYFNSKTREQLMGKKSGDSLSIVLGEAFEPKELEFVAQDLGLDIGHETTNERLFALEITKVGQLEKRELSEEFFKEIYPTEEIVTEEAFRKKIHDEIYNYWASQSTNQLHDQIFHLLVDTTQVELPEAVLKKLLKTQETGQNDAVQKTDEEIEKELPGFLKQVKWNLITDKIVVDNSISVSPDDIKEYGKQRLAGVLGGSFSNMEDQPWIQDYLNRMLQDRKAVEEAYLHVQTKKIFEWAATKVKPVSKEIDAEEFVKMVNEHHQHHH